jgi:AraC-like DNA-binding protein
MRAHFEKIDSGAASLRVFERADLGFPFYWHYHPEFELTLIVDSHGQRLVGDGIADYGPGDLVLLGPNLPHSWRSGPVHAPNECCHRAVVVHFREDFLGKAFFQLKEMEPIVRLLTRSASGLTFGQSANTRAIAQEIVEFPGLKPARRVVRLLDLLLDLAEEPAVKVLSTDRVRPMCRIEDQQRIEQVCTYLNERFEEEVNYLDIARRVHMDQASLCRFFKKATGRTMTAYVNEMRVGAAAQLLTDTDLSVLEIGFKVGFGNYSNFNRQFKRIKGYGPRTLRRQFLSHDAEPIAPPLMRDQNPRPRRRMMLSGLP